MVKAAETILGNFTSDGQKLLDVLVPNMAAQHLVVNILNTKWLHVTIYGTKPSCGYVPSGVKLPSMVVVAVTIDDPCPN